MKRRIIAAVLVMILLASSLLAIPLALADDEIPLPIVTDIPRVTPEPVLEEIPIDQPIEEPTEEPTQPPEDDTAGAAGDSTEEIITADQGGAGDDADSDAQQPTAEPTIEPTTVPGQVYLCGLEVHLHGEACLDAEGNAACGLSEHIHDETCPTADAPEYFCGMEAHAHGEACLDAEGNIACALQEHSHDEGCLIAPTAEPTAEPTPEPAPTAEPEYYCGLILHTHADSCYNESSEVVCGTQAHTHSEACLVPAEEETVYYCGLQEHSHADSCLDADGNIACGLEEHGHDDLCLIAPSLVYYCGYVEHSHDASCLDSDGNAVCGYFEHGHTLGCLAEPVPEPVYYCGFEQHIHDEACLDADGNIACGVQEHMHMPQCQLAPFTVALSCDPKTIYTGGMTALFSYTLSNGTAPYSLLLQDSVGGEMLYEQALDMPDAAAAAFTYQATVAGEHVISLTAVDSTGAAASAQAVLNVLSPETDQQWEAVLADIALTGDLRTDLIAIARSQLGYAESSENYILDDQGNARGYTLYGAWHGLPYGEWCAMFASYCLDRAGAELPLSANCADWVAALNEAGTYRPAAEYVPAAGDLVFFDRDADGAADHTGILEEVIFPEDSDEIRLTVIEGDSENQVARNEISLPDGAVLGYAQLGEAGDKQQVIEFVISTIDKLPAIDEFYIHLEELIDDPAAAEAYYTEVHDTAADAWVYYQCMGEAIRSYIPNGDKLMEYSFMWDVNMFVLQDSSSLKVYTLNYYRNHGSGTWRPVMVRGGTVQQKIPAGASNLNGYYYWTAIVVEEGENGLYVSQIEPKETNKNNLKATTPNGFVLIVHESDSAANAVALSVQIGEYVEVGFDYTAAASNYKSNGFGTVSFGLKAKAAKNNGLQGFRGEDTSDLIKIRMYNYNDSVNDKYSATLNDTVPYPGFQNPHGQTSSSQTCHSSFGDNVTKEIGLTSVAGSAKNGLNGLADGADSPLTDTMYKTLVNGYPAMSNGASLQYLFDSTYRVGGDANYLFQKNADSGQYWFNCRTNFAEFDGNTTFTLYNQTLTPNLTFYPFGNFLPFNRINSQAKKVADIDREYLMTILGSAEYKVDQGKDADGQLKRMIPALRQWITLMDDKYGTNWDWADAINAYMTGSTDHWGAGITDFDAENVSTITPNTLYSLDYDEPTDFFFGMNMEMDFIMPKDGWTGKDKDSNGIPDYETKFSFAGDDDVWVYIDDALFLDLSGIHRHVGGEINFMDGKVTRYKFQKSNSSAQTQYGESMTFRQILTDAGWSEQKINDALEVDSDGNETFKDYSEHNFKFYYMERGSGSSICQMGFNMPVLRENAISVGKALELNGAAPLGNPDFKFQVLKEDGSVMMTEGRQYTIYQGDPALGKKIGTGTVGANGIFTLKAGQYAQFSGITEDQGKYFVRELLDANIFNQYDSIIITGSSNTTANGTDVTIDSNTFKGYNSPVLDISAGSTTFKFTNDVNIDRLGSLQISKTTENVPDALSGDVFDFLVTIDGAELPVNTPYTVTDALGNTRNATVQTAGIISLKHGETAVIGNILAGSRFTVAEQNSTATSLAELATAQPEYTVAYYLDEAPLAAGSTSVSGIIRDGSQNTVAVSVTNTMMDHASVPIHITKSIANPDGKPHTYTFTLQQTSGDGAAVGEAQTVDIFLPAGKEKITLAKAFELFYRINEKGTYTYQITEKNTLETGTAYDGSVYRVTVNVGVENGGMKATISQITKDGEELSDINAPGEDSVIAFNNVLADSLTIHKIVDGTTANQQDTFSFTLQLRNAQDEALTGSFSAVKSTPTAEGEPVTEALTLTLDANGETTFTLKHGQLLAVNGLPNGTIWKVTEAKNHDYKTAVSVNGEEPVETSAAMDTIAGSGDGVVFTNTRLYVLPSTGGAGVYALYLLGAAFMLLAGIGLLNINKTRSGYKSSSGE